MAILQVRIKDGFFEEAIGRYVKIFEPTHVIADGWNCTISDNGWIRCDAIEKYFDGEHSMRYVIQPNGFAKLTLKVPGIPLRTLKKCYVIPKGTKLSNGIIGLASGPIDKRYSYFRNESFQEFLDEHGISAIRHENPNKNFLIRNASYYGGKCFSYLLTDGESNKVLFDLGRTKSWSEHYHNSHSYEEEVLTKVSGSTWVIHKQTQNEVNNRNCFSILYTLEKDLTKLVGLPNVREKEEKISKLREIGSMGFLSLEELKKSLLDVVPNLDRGNYKSCFTHADFIQVENVSKYRPDCLETSKQSSLIRFSSSDEAKKALEELKCLKFESAEMLEKYLLEHGFEDAELTRYYAYISKINNDSSRICIDIRTSTSRAKNFDNFFREFWKCKI